MGAAALSDFLTDFGARQRPSQAAVSPILAAVPATVIWQEPPPPPIDLEAEIAKAVAAAEADLSERMEAIYEARLAAERDAHAEALRDVTARLGAELGGKLEAAFAAAEHKTAEIATSAAARILAQVTSDAIANKAVADLAQAISGALGDVDAIRVRVRGPQSLFMPLSVAMGKHARHLDFIETSSPDLSVTIDETLFETRIAEWSRALDGVIG
jgi:hypothetical protein